MSTTERARRLAQQRPGAAVPCPACGAGVKGANLDRHLAKVHPGDAGVAHASRWTGPERVGSRWLLVLALLVAAGVAAYTVITGDQDDRLILGAGGLLAASMIVYGAVGWGAPLIPGSLRVDERGARLRHSYGLGRRRLRHLDTVELGSAWEDRSSGDSGNDASYTTTPARVGGYLRLRDGRRTITVHCRTVGEVRTTWSGWSQGKRTRSLDITLDRAEFVALQLALWELGVLAPR